jgi:hypothetical protein
VRPVRLESGETRCLGGNLPPQLRSLNVARDMCINLVLLLPDTDSGATGSLEISKPLWCSLGATHERLGEQSPQTGPDWAWQVLP